MTEEQAKKPANRTSGYFLIALGVIGIATRFISDSPWNTVTIVKMSVSVLALGFGLWTVLKKK